MRRDLLFCEIYNTPWALEQRAFQSMSSVLERWFEGVRLSEDEIRAAVGDSPEIVAARRSAAAKAGKGVVAVLPVYGVLSQRGNMVNNVSGPGGTSVAMLSRAFDEAVNDPSVSAIVMDIDSPGGSVFGIAELSQKIYDARSAKPVIAVANPVAASAAYWLAAAASEIAITPSGEAGSIGVLTEHRDMSKAMETSGVRKEYVYAGKYKVEGRDDGPLSADARAALQERVDAYYDMMVRGIAQGRNVAQKSVREGFGEGRVLSAQRAVKEGLVDRVATMDQVLGELMARGGARGARAEAATSESVLAKASPLELRERNDF